MGDICCSTQLIDGDGTYNTSGMENFTKTAKLGEVGLSYAVVSIMGPRISGKSTLLNHLFQTNFKEMDAFSGRFQTTKGIWLARCVGIEPCTIVMDLEGSDGIERGEDDTAFENQSALFALAVSDIVLINMWCHDIGRPHAANIPLFKTVFQVMMRLFSPRKTTLLFVIRDKTRTPSEILESILREDIQKIWDSIRKPQELKDTPLMEFFNVEVVALSSFEEKKEQFLDQVANLRHRFFHSIAPGGLIGDRRGVVLASEFSFSAQQIWKVIKENKNLHLPSHNVMVATVRCEEIANEKVASLPSNEECHQLEETVKKDVVSDFGKKISSKLESSLSRYDMKAFYFDEGVRTSKRQQLELKLPQLIQPTHQSMLGHLRFKIFENFKVTFGEALKRDEGFAIASYDCTQSLMSAFDEGCKDVTVKQTDCDTSKVREKLLRDINAYISSVRVSKIVELTSQYEEKLIRALVDSVAFLLNQGSDDTWPAIRRLLQREKKSALSGFALSLSSFDIDQGSKDTLLTKLEDHAKTVVESKAKEEAENVLSHMNNRFSTLFHFDPDLMPRIWTEKDDIIAITKIARFAALKLLSVMAVIRLCDDKDDVENTLSLCLLDDTNIGATNRPIQLYIITSSSWNEIQPARTLITPIQCKALWNQFIAKTNYIISQAINAQEVKKWKNKRNNTWSLAPWLIAAIFILGFNEFTSKKSFTLRGALCISKWRPSQAP